jgi:hypothetical protein
MKYKGFDIVASYTAGSNFRITKQDGVISRKPTIRDVEYYVIYDPMEGDSRFCAEDTVKECKETIDTLLVKLDMKSNLPKEWDKLTKMDEAHHEQDIAARISYEEHQNDEGEDTHTPDGKRCDMCGTKNCTDDMCYLQD